MNTFCDYINAHREAVIAYVLELARYRELDNDFRVEAVTFDPVSVGRMFNQESSNEVRGREIYPQHGLHLLSTAIEP